MNMGGPVEVVWLDSVQSTVWETPDDALQDAAKELTPATRHGQWLSRVDVYAAGGRR